MKVVSRERSPALNQSHPGVRAGSERSVFDPSDKYHNRKRKAYHVATLPEAVKSTIRNATKPFFVKYVVSFV